MGNLFELLVVSALIIGMAMAAVSQLILWFMSFRQSIWWGLGCVFIPGIPFVFAARNWSTTRKVVIVWGSGATLTVMALSAMELIRN